MSESTPTGSHRIHPTHADVFLPYDPAALPPVIARYLRASDALADRGSLLDAFASDAHVVDDGIVYRDPTAVRRWLTTVATEFTYTTTFSGQRAHRPDRWEVRARLEGDFPGGVAELSFRFRVRGQQITELVIEPS